MMDDGPIRSIVVALHGIKTSNMLAHINVFCEQEKFYCVDNKLWVQISTMPQKLPKSNILLIVENDIVTVRLLWGTGSVPLVDMNNETNEVVERKDARAWEEYFRVELSKAKKTLEDERANVAFKLASFENL